jgi:Tol biopolymer transport system component
MNRWGERPMPISAGTRFGAYEITGPLGAGGMGEVYRARDTELGRDVAIKVLPASFTSDASRVARFEQEAKTLASLNHPNIAHIYGLERSDGTTALAIELVEGPTLAERIAEGPLPVDEALGIAGQIADALEAAHERGIVHRDLKPANVKLTPNGVVKVLDFGIAKALDTRVTSSGNAPVLTTPAMTEAGIVLGTAAYMSPEQARGKPVDERADIWAFGCVLYEMLTGQLAFGGEDVTIVLARVLERSANLEALPKGVSPAVRRTLELCFEKDPRQRIADIRDVRLALAGVFTPSAPASTRLGWWQTRAAVASVALVAVAALTWLGWLASKPAPLLPETRVEIGTPPTTTPGSFAISPDGRRVVYTAEQQGRTSLWVRSLDTGDATLLRDTEGASFPFWSADGRAIAFYQARKLRTIDLSSGATRDLADAVGGRGGSWGRRGDIVFSPTGVSGIVRIPSQGGEPTAVTQIEGDDRHFAPSFLPDGRDFLFFAQHADGGAIYVASTAGGVSTRLVDADGPATYAAGHLLFIRQGRLFAQPFDVEARAITGKEVAVETTLGAAERNVIGVSASTTGTVVYRTESAAAEQRRLAWFDRAGLELLGVPGSGSTSFALSPDEQRVALARNVAGNTDLWIMDFGRGAVSRFTTDPSLDAHPVFSADGERLIYQRYFTERGVGDIYWRRVTGGADELLIGDARGKIPTDVSHDGRLLLFKATAGGLLTTWDVWAMPLTGGGKPIAVSTTPFDETDGQFSPDDKWVLFQSDESGQAEVYLQPFGRSGERVQVSIGGGAQPRWRADGREIFYVALDGKLMAVPVEPSADTAKAPILGRPVGLFTTRMGPLVAPVARQRYVPSHDGQRFLMSIMDPASPPLEVILNFQPARAAQSP